MPLQRNISWLNLFLAIHSSLTEGEAVYGETDILSLSLSLSDSVSASGTHTPFNLSK